MAPQDPSSSQPVTLGVVTPNPAVEVALGILSTKVEGLREDIKDLVTALKDHVVKDEAFYLKVDRLEQAAGNRMWHIKVLWAGLVTAILALASNIVLRFMSIGTNIR